MRAETVAEFRAAVRGEVLRSHVVIPRELATRMLEELPAAPAVQLATAGKRGGARHGAGRPRKLPTSTQQPRVSRAARLPRSNAPAPRGSKPAPPPNPPRSTAGRLSAPPAPPADARPSTDAWLAANPDGLQRLGVGEVSEANRFKRIDPSARGVRA